MKPDHKSRIFTYSNSAQLGLFGLLANDLEHYEDDKTGHDKDKKWTTSQILEVKRKFIRNCQEHNKSNPNQNIVLVFKKEEGGNDLVPTESTKKTIDHWFLNDSEKHKILHFNFGV